MPGTVLSLGRTRIHPSAFSGTTAHFFLLEGKTNYHTQTPGNYLLVNLIRWTLFTSEYALPKHYLLKRDRLKFCHIRTSIPL